MCVMVRTFQFQLCQFRVFIVTNSQPVPIYLVISSLHILPCFHLPVIRLSSYLLPVPDRLPACLTHCLFLSLCLVCLPCFEHASKDCWHPCYICVLLATYELIHRGDKCSQSAEAMERTACEKLSQQSLSHHKTYFYWRADFTLFLLISLSLEGSNCHWFYLFY